jgi:hypothetical protein
MRILVNESQLVNLSENVQLADKTYFKTGKLDDNDRNFILNITRGDQTTKLISDIWFRYKNSWDPEKIKKRLSIIHRELLEYNKNVFPIKGFDLYNPSGVDFYNVLMSRYDILDNLKSLPSIALRNLRSEFRIERDISDMHYYQTQLNYLIQNLSMLSNRDDETRKKILQKIFKSNTTLDDMVNFVDEKENLIGGGEFTREKIEEIINENDYDLNLVFDENNVMVIQVESPDAIKQIGCNSLWCFTYGQDNHQTWYNYSQYGMVYVIVNLNEPSDSSEFMWVLIRPLKWNEDDYENSPLFNMSNDNFYNPYSLLSELIGNKRRIKEVFSFDMEDEDEEYREICDEYDETLENIRNKYFNGTYELDNDFITIYIHNQGDINCKNGTVNITYLNKKTGDRRTGDVKIDKLPTYATNLQLFENKRK